MSGKSKMNGNSNRARADTHRLSGQRLDYDGNMRCRPRHLLAGLFAASVYAAEPSPVGLWKTIDDDTHEAKALVEISAHDGALSGHIIKLFRKPQEDQNPHCVDCTGERHNQPVLGMTILWDERRHGDTWSGGEILDPDGGEIYRCNLRLIDGGAKLQVRGYIGI